VKSGKPIPVLVGLRGLSARVAKKAGVSPSFVSHVIHGRKSSEKVTQLVHEELAQIGLPSWKLESEELLEGMRKYELYSTLRTRVIRRLSDDGVLPVTGSYFAWHVRRDGSGSVWRHSCKPTNDLHGIERALLEEIREIEGRAKR